MSKLSKFKNGEHVRATDPQRPHYDLIGRVIHVMDDGDPVAYRIQFGPRGIRAYPERDLTLADPDVHTVLDQMDAESGFVNPLAGIKPDPVNHPAHYTSHPSGVECIEITRHMGFNTGNAFKYIWRADLKGNAIQDLEKAAFYIADEIAKRKAAQ